MLDFEELVAELPIHVYWLDRDNIYRGCNNMQAKSFGLASRHEIVGKRNTDLSTITQEIADICDENNLKVMWTKQELLVEEPVIWPNGHLGVVLTFKKPWFDKKTKEVIGLIGVSMDLSKYKEEAAALAQAVEHAQLSLDCIISQMPAHVYWKNKDGVYLGCNDLQARNLGFSSSSEVIEKTDFELSKDALAAQSFWENDRRVMEKTGHEVVEEEVNLLGGQRIFLSSKTALKNTKGEVIGIIGISFDITDRKQMEAALTEAKEIAERANNAKSEFLFNMRHDLKTPFAGILGMAELLELTEKNAARKADLGCIRQSASILLEQINQIFDLVHVEEGHLPLLAKQFHLRNLLEDVLNIMTPPAKMKGLVVTAIVDDTLPDYLVGDQIRIERILINLVTNAIKFTEQGHVKLSVELIQKRDINVIIKFTVEDTGIGISQDQANLLFQSFSRLNPAYSSHYPGRGLGLRLVKQFLDDMGGEVYVDSQPGKGSIFKILIPLKETLLDCPETQL